MYFAFPVDNIVFFIMKLDWGKRNDFWVSWISIIRLKEEMAIQLALIKSTIFHPR
jgi:hypothetical protein